jgi:hypothetical protein
MKVNLNKPTTAVYSTRADIRTLAALVEYWIGQGENPSSISELHRLSLEVFVQLLQSKGMVKTWSSTSEAKRYLDSLNLSKSLSSRNQQALIKQMQKEDLELEGISLDYMKRKTTKTASKDQFEAAKDILDNKIKEKTDGIIGAKIGEVKDGKED